MKCWWAFDAFFTFYVYSMDLFGAFDGFSIDTRWMFGRYSMNAPFRTFYPLLPISHFLFPMQYVSFRLSFAHFPLPMARPGGMRGAIEYGQPLAGSAVLDPRTDSESETIPSGRP